MQEYFEQALAIKNFIVRMFYQNQEMTWMVSVDIIAFYVMKVIFIDLLLYMVFVGWQPRWFVLDNGILSYYDSQDDVCKGSKGSIKMAVCEIKGK